MSFGEKRDDGKTKVPTRSTRNASRLGRKKKGTTTTTTRFAPFKDVLYHHERDGSRMRLFLSIMGKRRFLPTTYENE